MLGFPVRPGSTMRCGQANTHGWTTLAFVVTRMVEPSRAVVATMADASVDKDSRDPDRRDSTVRRERVTGPAPCAGTVYADGYWWVKLYLGSGGYGWTAAPYLHYIGYY